MSGEDDTFDIDIYGDENEEAPATGQNDNTEENLFDEVDYYGDGDSKPQDGANNTSQDQSESAQQDHSQLNSIPQPAQQGTKRKAEDDQGYDNSYQNQRQSQAPPQNIDPSATPALKLSDLHWWTTEEDLRAFLANTKTESQLIDLSFGEHKINGKSRGEAYLEFSSPSAADAVKKEIEKQQNTPFKVYFAAAGNNPFKGRDSGAQGKSAPGRGGAYNQNFAQRGGGFRGGFQRGGGFNNRGGGGFQQQQQPQQQQNWNPMMNNPMMMGMAGAMGFNNMGRGGMMGGRGGFMGAMPNMGMGGMGMGGRGGMMGGRGGYGGGFQQNVGQGGYGGGGYAGGPNKRMKEG